MTSSSVRSANSARKAISQVNFSDAAHDGPIRWARASSGISTSSFRLYYDIILSHIMWPWQSSELGVVEQSVTSVCCMIARPVYSKHP